MMFRLTVAILSCCFFFTASAFVSDYTDRIINGEDADILDFPYQCSLQKLENHACGCSILNNKVVLTAAHCLVGSTQSEINHMQVRAGSVFWSTGGALKKVDKILLHPDYNTDTMANDVALIKLSSALVFSNTIKPIKLATSNPPDDTEVVISGWGYKKEDVRNMSNKLQAAKVKFIAGKTCSSALYKYSLEIKDGMVCGVGGEKDACQGDSGGPLVNPITGDQVGVVSWGYGCAQAGYPGIYADVNYYRAWILKNANSI